MQNVQELTRQTTLLEAIAGNYGFQIFSAGTYAINSPTIGIREDTVISVLEIDGDPTNLVKAANAEENYNISGVTLLVNEAIPAPKGSVFTRVTVVSGTIRVFPT